MERTALSIGKSALSGALGYAKSALADEVALQLGVTRDQAFIRDELEMMLSFLMAAHEERDKHMVVETWVKQVRVVAYDVEDSLMDFSVRVEKQSWWLPWRIPRTLSDRRHVAKLMKDLRAKVEDVSQRKNRYLIEAGSSSKATASAGDTTVTAAAMFGINEARYAAKTKEQPRLDLAQLINKQGEDLGVIAVWGTSGNVGHMSIIREAYDNSVTLQNFHCRAWVKVMHPFSPKDFFQCLLEEAVGVDVLMETKKTGQALAEEFHRYVNDKRCLIVLNGLSTIEDWYRIKKCFRINKKGSKIIVSTKDVEVASLCVGQNYVVSELKQLSADQTIYAFYKEPTTTLSIQISTTPDFVQRARDEDRDACTKMGRTWMNARLFSKEHRDGVNEFLDFVSENLSGNQQILCPCRKCLNRLNKYKGEVEDHLLMFGMSSTYTRWIHHGEGEPENDEHLNEDIGCNVEHVTEDVGCNGEFGTNEPQDDPEDDEMHRMVQDLYPDQNHGPRTKSKFSIILEEMKQMLHPDGPYTRFSFVVKLLHIKSFYRISNAGFSAFLDLLSSAFPNCSIPASYDEAKKVIRALGLGYDSIHVCPNNCVLFRKELAKENACPICKASRWKDGDGRRKIPEKVLRHFPLIPRLKRIFRSKELSTQAQWHKLKRKPVDNELSHPADGEAWKDFDRKYEWFANDARNVRLGLATDGFNPFGKMSSSYSMWPVFLIPYNFPPWQCVEQFNFMMCLLIPGPACPGKDMDLFLQPLVEELLNLWSGVPTLDALTGKEFDLHAAVIWCIHDYPALSTLSGRIAKGYYACVRCDKNPCSKRLRNKICYIGHRRFLPADHIWRRKKDFDGQTEERAQPEEFSQDELMQQLARVEHVKPGDHPNNKKRKRVEEGQCWKRKSTLWDLPYWSSLKLRHNLDVMHIEKNICEALLGTFLNITGKSKDSISARLDLEDMGIRKSLHLKDDGNSSYSVPHAPYTMTKAQISAFCAFIKNVKFPDGYASNLARCVSVDECKLQALKTHDCHILLQRILPVGLRGIMHKDIYEAIAELGNFFQQICAKKLKLDVLNRMRGEIPIILCKLEKIFPPAFFDVMVHLSIHLIDDAILRGPVQYGWMYPVERRLLTLKRFVRNMARPEGSIAEAYVANECLTACSRYFDDVETRHNREGRNKERVAMSSGGFSIFQHGANLLGATRLTYDEKDYDRMVWYVLNNTTEVEPFIEIYRNELETAGNRDIEGNLAKEFPVWFKKHLATRRFVDGEEISEDLYALGSLPHLRLRKFSGCIVGGVRYHTVDRESSRKTQNSGVMVEGSHNGEDIDFYGHLKEVIELQYNSDDNSERTVVLFKCDWFDTCSKNSRMKDDGYFKSISHSSFWYKDDAFILATQATKVFYLDDNKHGEPWKVVQTFSHRHLWNVNEEENDDMQEGGIDLTYQDDEQEISRVAVQEGSSVEEQSVNKEDGISVEASLVDQIRMQRDLEVEEHDLYNDHGDDDTLGQYDSENECTIMIPNDDGEYSDVE